MKTTATRALLLLALAILWAAPAAAQVETPATHAILVDAGTGAVLLDKNADGRMPTSSMSKTMTVYMAFEALRDGKLKLDDTFTVSEKAWRMGGSRMFADVHTQVKVEDLLRGVIIQSGNDAAVALAEGLMGSEEAFAAAMTARAQDMGMKNSSFVNASGWPDPGHYSTPRDLALLAYRVIHDFPDYYPYFAEKEFTYNRIRQPNRDPLPGRVPGADGLKTGHTEVAGYGLIGSAKRGDRRLILVLNGLTSEQARADEGARLLEWGFRTFENVTLVSAGQEVETAEVWLGMPPSVSLVPEKDVNILVPVAGRSGVKMTVSYLSPLKAPVKKGEKAATLRVDIPGQPPLETDLVAGADVPVDGITGRVKSRLKHLMAGTR